MKGGIYIALGANLGRPAETLAAALRDLESRGDIRVLRASGFHATAPVGGPPGQPPYLNAAAEIDTDLGPVPLLTRLQEIEAAHGRTRAVRHGPRTLDLDLLLYRDLVLETPELTLPHPRMWERDFVLTPLAEISNLARLRQVHRPRRTGP